MMRRSALFLLTLHLAAAPLLAQSAAPYGTLEVHQGDRVTTFTHNGASGAATNANETLVSFDPQHVEVVWSQNHWQLVADAHVLKDFGRREVEARLALRLVRDLHLTQHGVIGSPEPVMEYWLSNGRAPHGMTSGLHLVPVDPATLKVEQTQSQWCVRDSAHVLFNFRSNENDARNALAILRKYGFTQIGTLGGMGPSMIVMLGHFDSGTDANTNGPHLVHQSPLRPAPDDPKAPKKQIPSDMNAPVTPAIPPLQTAHDANKQKLNEFGHNETIEVLPASFSSPAMSDGQTKQGNVFGHAETGETPRQDAGLLQSKRFRHAAALALIDHAPFDWRHFQIRPESGGSFSLVAGTFVLARFKSDHDARMAMAVVQHYRFTELDHIGRPQSFCSYFLCNGQAPRGQFIGMRAEPFVPEKLKVALVDNRWAIVSPDKALLLFGNKPEEAHVMLDVIQHQQFDRLCRVGDEHGLMFFVRSH